MRGGAIGGSSFWLRGLRVLWDFGAMYFGCRVSGSMFFFLMFEGRADEGLE